MMLLINQWHHRESESQKTLVTLCPIKIEREVFNKEKLSKIMLVEKKIKKCMFEKIQLYRSSRIYLERQYLSVQERLLRFIYQITPEFAEETESCQCQWKFKWLHFHILFVSKAAAIKLQMLLVFLEHQLRL